MQFLRFAPLALAASVSAETLANVLSANNDTLSTLNGVLAMVPEVSKMLMSTNNLTILAPSNDAFNKLFQEMPMAKDMVQNKTFVTALLQYHVMSGMIMSNNFMEMPQFVPTMLSMTPMAMESSTMESSTMESMPMGAMPMGLTKAPMAKKEEPMAGSSMPMAGSSEPMAGSSMPMAGSSEPMAGSSMPMAESSMPMAMPAASMGMMAGMQMVELQLMNKMAMIFSGFKQMSTVTKADIVYDMGVVHVIDKVLTMPGSPSQTALDMGYTSFAGALMKTNMVSAVDGLSGATIFVPNNNAFEAVGSTVNMASTKDLMSVLNYHVLSSGGGTMFSTMLEGMTSGGMSSGMGSEMGGSSGSMMGSSMSEMSKTTMMMTMSGQSMPMQSAAGAAGMPPMPMPPAGEAGMPAMPMPPAGGEAGMPAMPMPMSMSMASGGAAMPKATGQAAGMMPAAGMPMEGGSMASATGMSKATGMSMAGENMPMATGMPMAGAGAKGEGMNMPMPMPGMAMPGMPMKARKRMDMPMNMPMNMPMEGGSMPMAMMTKMLETLAGGNLTVRMESNGDVFVNSAKVVTADIITNNGVMHVVDNVLNPMAADSMPNPTAASQSPAFAGATPVQEAPFTSGLTPTTTMMAATMNAAGGHFAAAMPTAALLMGGAAAVLANL